MDCTARQVFGGETSCRDDVASVSPNRRRFEIQRGCDHRDDTEKCPSVPPEQRFPILVTRFVASTITDELKGDPVLRAQNLVYLVPIERDGGFERGGAPKFVCFRII